MTAWTVGQLVTAALMNSNIQALGNFVLAPPLCSTYASVSQSIPNNTSTPILFDTNVLDSDSGHSTITATSRYVVQVAGVYVLFGALSFAVNGSGARNVAIAKNGSVVAYIQGQVPANTSSTTVPFIGMLPLVAGDYIEMWGFQSSGGSLSANAGASCLNVLRVSN